MKKYLFLASVAITACTSPEQPLQSPTFNSDSLKEVIRSTETTPA